MDATLTLTPRDLAALKARRDFPVFCRIAYRPYTEPPHLRMLNAALVEVERYIATRGADGIGRLRIELPPRHGKSQTVARLFPAWVLGRHPNLRIIIASHGAGLSEGHSRFVRNTLRSTAYRTIFPAVALSSDSQDRAAWDMQEPLLGGLLAVGTGGSVTGRGAGLIVCDDLVKSREEVESEAARDKLWDWYTSDLLTRQEPHAAIIHIGTRWHMDDILGRLALREPGNWHVIRLPALAEENDPLEREPGAALWPERFDRAAILAQADVMGDYAFSALYQQNPISSAGGVFARDKFNQMDNLTRPIVEQVRFWDLAISEKKTADYTVGVLLGRTDDKRIVVLDVQRFRLGWQAAMDKITRTAQDDGKDTRIGVEKVAFSAAAVSQLIDRPELHSYSIRGVEVHKDKLTRALPFAARVDAGVVDCLRRGWTADLLDELASFPNGRHDDQVDAIASAYEMLSTRGAISSGPNPFYGELDGYELSDWQFTPVAPKIRTLTGVDRIDAAALGAELDWRNTDAQTVPCDFSTADRPDAYSHAKLKVTYVRNGATTYYVRCMRCNTFVPTLFESPKNGNWVCEHCLAKERITT